MAKSPSAVILDGDHDKVKLSEKSTEYLPKDELEGEEEALGWLPDGWLVEVNRGDDGNIYRYYTSPVSGYTFTNKSQVLEYLFSGMDERFLESKDCAVGKKLARTHDWLPNGWILEIRAGGENMDKMFKFYVNQGTGVRLFSKEDVLLYINETKISGLDTNGQCDIFTKDNILATVEFNPYGLPEGWVKEIVFRKTKNGVRKDPYYTDPVSNSVFRTRKLALLYLATGNVPKRAFVQRTNVHDLYSFEKSASLHESLQKRLIFKPRTEKKVSGGQSSCGSEDGESSDGSDSAEENEENKFKRVTAAASKGKGIASNTTTKRSGVSPSKRAIGIKIKQERE